MNSDTRHAVEFHEATKHSQVKLQTSRHYPDWDIKPRPFKVYTGLRSIPLPGDFSVPAANALSCAAGVTEAAKKPVDIQTLAQILFFSAGITRVMRFQSGTYYMRAASATGALYPIELYLVCKDIGGLAAGVYHFCPGDFSLAELRSGDYTGSLAAMAADPDVAASPATVVFTSLAWRNAWKYRARSYRHWFWDSGVIAANLLATCCSEGLHSKLIAGFADSEVNELLLLEKEKEAAIALAPIAESFGNDGMELRPTPVPAASRPNYIALSSSEVEFPEIWQMHEASSLATSEVAAWKALRVRSEKPGSAGRLQFNSLGLGETVLRRGSSRSFARSNIPKEKLLSILYCSTRGVPFDVLKDGQSLADIYFVANAVEGLEPGRYFYDSHANTMKLLEAGTEAASRNESGYLCLGQPLFSDASAVMFLMADLDSVLKTFGNRGYRVCQLESSVVAGKIYLSAYAQGLGASGSTFYDDAVAESFSPHATGKAAMIVVGVGVAAYRARPGAVLPVRLTKSELLSQ